MWNAQTRHHSTCSNADLELCSGKVECAGSVATLTSGPALGRSVTRGYCGYGASTRAVRSHLETQRCRGGKQKIILGVGGGAGATQGVLCHVHTYASASRRSVAGRGQRVLGRPGLAVDEALSHPLEQAPQTPLVRHLSLLYLLHSVSPGPRPLTATLACRLW
jgi:hypothetical protein